MIKTLGIGSALAAMAISSIMAGAQAPTTGTTAAAKPTTGTAAVAPAPSLVADTITITTDTKPLIQNMLEATTGTQTQPQTTIGSQIVSATSGTLSGASQTLADILGTTGTTPSTTAPAEVAAPQAPAIPTTGAAVAPPEGEEPVYMQKRGEMRIFDPGRGEGVSPLQQAVQQMREQTLAERKPIQSRVYDIASYHYVIEGKDEASAVREAELRALMSASARLYFGDKIIIGRELLRPYLARSGEKAIADVVIDRRPHVLADGKLQMPIRVSVNVPMLFQDLADKQFVAEPNIRPRMTIHVREMVDGKPASSTPGADRLTSTMENNLFRIHSKEMEKPALNIDLSKDAGQFQTARLEAERNNIDVILTGSINTLPITTGQILYDTYHFWKTDLDLYLYRVDNGELVAHLQDSYSAAGDSTEHAIAKTLDVMVGRTGGKLAMILRDVWPSTMLNEMDYRLMISGVDLARLGHIESMLKALCPEMRIYRKAFYGDVAVINIVLPEGKTIDLGGFLRRATDPQLIVRRYDDRHYEIEPIG
ncbi:MAG: hypothetical protein ABFD69_12335 [Candidatus Sumerlaeia bacterium]